MEERQRRKEMFIICRRTQRLFLHLFFLFLTATTISYVSCFPCKDTRCKTSVCHENGTCICNLPHSSTILDGNRHFLGGRFCDEEHMMCDGTNSFWCEHGAICQEVIHGENYTCNCPRGYAGLHCEHVGAPCGNIFCFHEAECLVEDYICGCPPNWRGSIDCSLPTITEKVTNPSVISTPTKQNNDDQKWFVAPVTILSCLVGVTVAVILIKKYSEKSEPIVAKFQQLSEMQIKGFLEDEADDSVDPVAINNDSAHL